MTRARRTSALLAAGLLALGACSGGGDAAAPRPIATPSTPAAAPAAGGDEARIVALARAAVLAQSVGNLCSEKFSARFVQTVFGSVRRCEKSFHPDHPDNRTQDAQVSDVKVNGLAATATVTEIGGEWAGARGTWAFIRVGDDWRIAAWGPDYLRAAFRVMFGPERRSADPGNLFSDPAVLACVSKEVQSLGDRAFTRFAYRMFREDARGTRELNGFLRSCAIVPGEDGRTPLRRTFEVGVRRGAERGGVPELAECMTRRLRTEIKDEDLLRVFDSFVKTGKYPKPLQRRASHASLDCALANV